MRRLIDAVCCRRLNRVAEPVPKCPQVVSPQLDISPSLFLLLPTFTAAEAIRHGQEGKHQVQVLAEQSHPPPALPVCSIGSISNGKSRPLPCPTERSTDVKRPQGIVIHLSPLFSAGGSSSSRGKEAYVGWSGLAAASSLGLSGVGDKEVLETLEIDPEVAASLGLEEGSIVSTHRLLSSAAMVS